MKYFSIFQTRSIRFYKLFISYVVIVLAFLFIISAFSYGLYFTTLQEEIVASSLSSLSQVRDIMDGRVKEMQITASHISAKSNLVPTALTERGYWTWQAAKDLTSFKSSLSYVHDIILYYPDATPDTIYASSGVYNFNDFFDQAYKFTTIDKNRFIEIITGLRTPYMIPSETVQSYNSEKGLLAAFIQPIPVDSNAPKGYAVFLIDGDETQKMLGNLLINRTGFVYIVDENDRMVLSSINSSEIPDSKIMDSLNLSKDFAVQKLELNKKDLLAIKVASVFNKWSYVKIVPYKLFMSKVFGIQKVFNLTAIIILITGLMLSFIFALYGYKPLQRLVEAVSGQSKVPQKNIDEISFILNKINETENEKKNLTAVLKSKSGIVKEQLLTSVINGKVASVENLEEILDLSGIKIEKPYFIVMYFTIDDYENFSRVNSRSIQNLYEISIRNVIEELAQDIGIGYSVNAPDGNGIALIINSGLENISNINNMAGKVLSFFKENFDFTLTVGVGKPYSSLYDTHLSYDEAVNASSYKLIQGPGSVIFSENLDNAAKNDYFPKQELSEKIAVSLKQAKIDEIDILISQHIEAVKAQMPSLLIVQYFQYTIIMSVMNVIQEFGLQEIKKEFESSLVDINNKTLTDFKNNILFYCSKISNTIISRKESKNFDLRDRLLEYINENYNDCNISLNTIAEKFNSSSSYITRFFKDQMGCSLMKYVDSLRMDKARELLKTTTLNLRSIAENVGYVDEENFARKFKNIEGLTPIQYRKASNSNTRNGD